jgi:hypothetical protein
VSASVGELAVKVLVFEVGGFGTGIRGGKLGAKAVNVVVLPGDFALSSGFEIGVSLLFGC